jgi:hypothetical protein
MSRCGYTARLGLTLYIMPVDDVYNDVHSCIACDAAIVELNRA